MRPFAISCLFVCALASWAPSAEAQQQGATDPNSNDWRFDFHGYFRAPMRIGFGHQDQEPSMKYGTQSKNTIHSPILPDDQYYSWQYTSVQSKDWAELFFSYGNSVVKGVVGLQGYNFTDASWQDPNAQFGIAQGFLVLTPNTGYQNLHLEAKAGAFWDKYGMAGRYDTGKYDTYLFGRTHQIGESLKAELDLGRFTLWAQQGIGTKQPDPNIYNPAKFSMLAHFHGGVKWNRTVDFGLHLLHAWSSEEDRANAETATPNYVGLPNGSLTIFGPELAIRNTMLGDLYLGYSHIGASHATVVNDIVEVIHAGGGGTFQQGIQGNYLEANPKGIASKGNGSVDTILLQYDVSLANLLLQLREKKAFWGDGPDLTASLFMMFNAIKSDDKTLNGPDGNKKLKFGVDLLGTPLKWLGVGMRVDRVQPNSRVGDQSFTILSPRLVFKTAFVTHEEISLQYSRYMYSRRDCPDGDTTHCVQPPSAPSLPNGFGTPIDSIKDDKWRGVPGATSTSRGQPDLDVLKIQATMWW